MADSLLSLERGDGAHTAEFDAPGEGEIVLDKPLIGSLNEPLSRSGTVWVASKASVSVRVIFGPLVRS